MSAASSNAGTAPVASPVLRTARLLLRRPEAHDAPVWEVQCRPIEMARNALRMPHPYPEGAALEWINKVREAQLRGEAMVLAMIPCDDNGSQGEMIGAIGLHIDPAHRHAEMGYSVGIAHWGRGYASEAAKAMVDFAFGTLGLERIHAGYYTRNPASGRVLEKLGFVREGLRERMYMRFGDWVDVVLVRMLRSEWEARRSGVNDREVVR